MADKTTNSVALQIIESSVDLQKKMKYYKLDELMQAIKQLELNRENIIKLQAQRLDIEIETKRAELNRVEMEIAGLEAI